MPLEVPGNGSPVPLAPHSRRPRAVPHPQEPTPQPQPSPYFGSSAPAMTNTVPLGGGGGGGGGGGETPTPGGGGEGFGPFGSFDQWAAQFQAEHGRQPGEQDVYDAIDSFNFLAMTGRSPTNEEWRNRYYTGSWIGGGGGGGWGGGGYGGYGGGGGQQGPFGWNPSLTFWNYR